MKLCWSLALLVVLVPAAAFGQGVRMSADFLPLAVGNRWSYEISNEEGRKVGELDFSVQEHNIVSGRSFYVLTQFPFSSEPGIRVIRYDRIERQFIRTIGDEESPLFLQDGTTTKVLQADSAGLPQKFTLETDTAALTFQRGVGIVEARLQTPNGIQVAKIKSVRVGEGLPGAGTAAPAVATAAGIPEAPKAGPPDQRGRDLVENLTTITEENPRMELTAAPVPGGKKLTLTVTNTADKLLPFQFRSSQGYDFIITNPATGQEIWRWSRGTFFTQVVRSEAIRARGNWTFEAVWNQHDNEGNPVPPGQYRVGAVVSSQPSIESEPITIDVP